MPRIARMAMVCSLVLGCGGSGGESTGDPPLTETDSGTVDGSGDVTTADTGVDTTPADTFVPCKADSECAMSADGKACDTASGKCVPCTATSDLCPASEHCDPTTKKCIAGCKSDDGCASAGDAGLDGGDGGETGASLKSRCDVAANKCVECVKDEHCAAGFLCVGNVCSAGCSTTKPCPSGASCCSGACVDAQTNTDHCGMCGTKCTSTTGTAKCEGGLCKVATCTGTLKDCDGDFTNGCEVDTATTVAHCGGCGMLCSPSNVTSAKCEGSGCSYDACTALFADCDSNKANGCEKNVAADVANCGACGNTCAAPPNSSSTCVMGSCGYACNAGFGDCDGSAGNGCETSLLTDPSSCGMCGRACAIANGTGGCASGACTVGACNIGFRDCNALVTDGCEVNVASDVNNCGACGTACSVANGSASCVSGSCGVAACSGTFKNCNGLYSDGCESNSASDPNNCGSCGNVCPVGVLCNAGACLVPTSCQALRTAIPTAPSGRYRIDPDGSVGPTAAFDVYCEMIGTEGWTLALKADGTQPTFAYGATHWTTNTTLNTTSTDLSSTQAKFQSFNTMPYTQLRLGMREGTVDRFIIVSATGTSLLNTFATLGYVATTAGRAEWSKLVGTPRLQPYCSREGTNNAVGGYASVRIGLIANQENECNSPDSFIGFGAGPVACLAGTTPLTVGNVGACGASPSDGTTATFGLVFIR